METPGSIPTGGNYFAEFILPFPLLPTVPESFFFRDNSIFGNFYAVFLSYFSQVLW